MRSLSSLRSKLPQNCLRAELSSWLIITWADAIHIVAIKTAQVTAFASGRGPEGLKGYHQVETNHL